MGLLGHVLDDRLAFGHGRCHHDVDGGADADDIKEDVAALQMTGLCMDKSVLGRYRRAECTEALQMLVDGAGADVTAARQRYRGVASLAEKRAEKIVGSADFLNVIVVDKFGMNRRSVDADGVPIHPIHNGSDS